MHRSGGSLEEADALLAKALDAMASKPGHPITVVILRELVEVNEKLGRTQRVAEYQKMLSDRPGPAGHKR